MLCLIINNTYICFAIISGSGMCDASQFPPDRLVLSITSMVVQLELLDFRNVLSGSCKGRIAMSLGARGKTVRMHDVLQ